MLNKIRLLCLLVCCTVLYSVGFSVGAIGTAAAPPFDRKYVKATEIISGHPTEIIVPSLGIDIPIVDGVYTSDTASWTLNHATAQYAVTTPEPNDATGNTFVYGHNNHLVFSALTKIQPGAEVIIGTSNGDRFHYRFENSVDVSPENVSIIMPSIKPTLTIQTCVGQYFQTRRMFHFVFTNVEEAPLL